MVQTIIGLNYIPLDLATSKLFVFVDGFFANNADLSSQLGYLIVIGNEESKDFEFKLRGNIIHWSSTKSKRVTRSVLASEILAMSEGVDKGFVLAATSSRILSQLNLPPIPLDPYSTLATRNTRRNRQ